MVEVLGKLIEQEAPQFKVKMLPRARIPIIKLTMPKTQSNPHEISCDIGFENRLALENTRLLLTYAMADPRLRTIVLFCKLGPASSRADCQVACPSTVHVERILADAHG